MAVWQTNCQLKVHFLDFSIVTHDFHQQVGIDESNCYFQDQELTFMLKMQWWNNNSVWACMSDPTSFQLSKFHLKLKILWYCRKLRWKLVTGPWVRPFLSNSNHLFKKWYNCVCYAKALKFSELQNKLGPLKLRFWKVRLLKRPNHLLWRQEEQWVIKNRQMPMVG